MSVLNITRIALAWELHLEGIPQTHIAQRTGIDRVTVWRWIQGITQAGELALFLEQYQHAKKGVRKKRKIDAVLKRRIWNLRDTNKDCCGQKVRYFLKRDFGDIFACTAIDIFTRETDVLLRPSLEATDGQFFLQTAMERRFNNVSQIIQTDGGSEFKAEFHQNSKKYCNWHRFARPYKKNEQSYIESFNRSLRKECLGWLKYKQEQMRELTARVNDWLVYYHYQRPHIGLGMKPPLTKDRVLHI